MLKSKLLGSFLLILGSLPVLAVDGDFSGQYRLRASATMAAPDVNDLLGSDPTIEGLDIRAAVSGSFRPSEAFEGNATLYTQLDSAALNVTPLAYGDWMISDEFMLRAGRSTYSIADGSVIGKNDNNAVPVFFDGLFLTHSSEMLGVDVVVAKNPNQVLKEGEEVDTLGIVSLEARSLPELLNTLNIHVIAPLADLNSARAGLTVGGGSMGVGYRLTAAVSGLDFSNLDKVQDQFMVDAKVSYAHEMDEATVKVHVGGHMDTAGYDAFLYDTFKKSGKLEKLVWGSGIQYAKAGISYWQNSDIGVGLTGYYVVDVEDATAGVSEGDIEVDVYLKKVFNSSVSGKIWVGALQTENDIQVTSQAVAQMRF